ncbi:MauE/DoxX family redox-associated membrane protein [Pedobacter foliorum]|uniref:MauE/DoxX family redox-associated membrane protein n=1 Tax=Pedobacter foliorum TaxID=2739058 RepID=UPI0015670FE4|nr:MauE/DoxX family redox-associated membrane protein [Pedobacter foliorum]NRF41241.1 hypothetical protein [Pedobacter foliorum]
MLFKKNEFITQVSALLLIVLSSYTAMNKLIYQDRFAFQLQLIPWSVITKNASLIGISIPLIQLTIALMLCFGRYRLFGLLGALILLSVFEIYLITLIWNYENLPCSCGGISAHLNWTSHIIINAILITTSAYVIWRNYGLKLLNSVYYKRKTS